jgi:hypothetical protein
MERFGHNLSAIPLLRKNLLSLCRQAKKLLLSPFQFWLPLDVVGKDTSDKGGERHRLIAPDWSEYVSEHHIHIRHSWSCESCGPVRNI